MDSLLYLFASSTSISFLHIYKGYDSVPSQPPAPANFSLIDLISSLAEPGPGKEENSTAVTFHHSSTEAILRSRRKIITVCYSKVKP